MRENGFRVPAQGLTPERYKFGSSTETGEKAECKGTGMDTLVDLGGRRLTGIPDHCVK